MNSLTPTWSVNLDPDSPTLVEIKLYGGGAIVNVRQASGYSYSFGIPGDSTKAYLTVSAMLRVLGRLDSIGFNAELAFSVDSAFIDDIFNNNDLHDHINHLGRDSLHEVLAHPDLWQMLLAYYDQYDFVVEKA